MRNNRSVELPVRFLAAIMLLSLASSCVAALPAVIVATSNRVAIEYDPEEGVRSTATLAEEICSEAGGQAQFEATEGAVAKYTCMQLSLPAVVSANPTQVAIEFDPNEGINSTRALAESKCTEVGKQVKFVSTTGNIAGYDCIEPVLTSSQASAQPALSGPATAANCSSALSADKNTLRGFIALGVPVTSALITVTDGKGQQIGRSQVTIGTKGFFRLPLNASIPAKFQVQATVTSPAFQPPTTSVDLHTEKIAFLPDGFGIVFLNPVTTLISVYHNQRSELTRRDAIQKVTQFLDIPPHVNPGRAGIFSDVFFSPRQFWAAAEKTGGFESIIAQLIHEIDRGKKQTRSFAARTPLSNAVLIAGSRDPIDPNDWYLEWRTGQRWSGIGKALSAISNRIFQSQSLAKLDEIIGQLDLLNKAVTEILERLERAEYDSRTRILTTEYGKVKARRDEFEGIIAENNDYVSDGVQDPCYEIALAERVKSLMNRTSDAASNFLSIAHDQLIGENDETDPKSLITFWSKISHGRFTGDPYFEGLKEHFGYYQAMQIEATYLMREAVGEGQEPGKQPDEPEECLPNNQSNPYWMCKYVDRSKKQEEFLKDRETLFKNVIPEHTVWDKKNKLIWTGWSVKGCTAAWSTHRNAAEDFKLGPYRGWEVASKEDYQALLDESPKDQPAWDYLNILGFTLNCGLEERSNTRGYYSRTVDDDRAWVLGLDGSLELRCKHGDCGEYPYQEPWKARGALFNRDFETSPATEEEDADDQ